MQLRKILLSFLAMLVSLTNAKETFSQEILFSHSPVYSIAAPLSGTPGSFVPNSAFALPRELSPNHSALEAYQSAEITRLVQQRGELFEAYTRLQFAGYAWSTTDYRFRLKIPTVPLSRPDNIRSVLAIFDRIDLGRLGITNHDRTLDIQALISELEMIQDEDLVTGQLNLLVSREKIWRSSFELALQGTTVSKRRDGRFDLIVSKDGAHAIQEACKKILSSRAPVDATGSLHELELSLLDRFAKENGWEHAKQELETDCQDLSLTIQMRNEYLEVVRDLPRIAWHRFFELRNNHPDLSDDELANKFRSSISAWAEQHTFSNDEFENQRLNNSLKQTASSFVIAYGYLYPRRSASDYDKRRAAYDWWLKNLEILYEFLHFSSGSNIVHDAITSRFFYVSFSSPLEDWWLHLNVSTELLESSIPPVREAYELIEGTAQVVSQVSKEFLLAGEATVVSQAGLLRMQALKALQEQFDLDRALLMAAISEDLEQLDRLISTTVLTIGLDLERDSNVVVWAPEPLEVVDRPGNGQFHYLGQTLLTVRPAQVRLGVLRVPLHSWPEWSPSISNGGFSIAINNDQTFDHLMETVVRRAFEHCPSIDKQAIEANYRDFLKTIGKSISFEFEGAVNDPSLVSENHIAINVQVRVDEISGQGLLTCPLGVSAPSETEDTPFTSTLYYFPLPNGVWFNVEKR